MTVRDKSRSRNDKKSKPPAQKVARAAVFFLLEAQFFEEKAPNHIQPADDDTGRYGNYDTDNQPKNSAFFEPGAPPYDYFHHSVYTGNEKEDNLHKAGKFVKPGHISTPY